MAKFDQTLQTKTSVCIAELLKTRNSRLVTVGVGRFVRFSVRGIILNGLG